MIERIAAWEPLAQYKQFILHNAKKEPLDYKTLKPGNPHSPANWLSLDDAIAMANMYNLGVGFVITEDCPIHLLDIDHCFVDGKWSPLAQWLMQALAGSYLEVSMSGDGLHCLFTGDVPDHSCKNIAEGVELYTEGRYVALTGTSANGNAMLDCTAGAQQIVQKYFQPTFADTADDWNTEAVEGWDGLLDDAALIQRMTSSGSADARAAEAFGGNDRKATFNDLWTANAAVLGFSYPHDSKPYDESSADAALAQHLAFWTGNNHERMKQLMLQSALVRDKWDWHKNYLTITIKSAAKRQTQFHQQRRKPDAQELKSCQPTSELMSNEAMKTQGHQFMGVDQQIEYFQGCVYVQSDHRIMTPRGHLMKQENFNAVYGGYDFTMTSDNVKTTNKPWDAFLLNQAVNFPKADHKIFRPALPAGVIVNEDGHKGVNIYVPVETKRTNADVTPFLNHIRLLFPEDIDRQIIMCYMASLIQNPGVKFAWCPVIQGVEGNGKTFIMRVMEFCVGSRYCHFPNAGDLGGNGFKFNAWLFAKLFVGCDEIHTNGRQEVLDGLKSIITNTTLEYQYKGRDQFVGDNLSNWMTFTNHKDAVPTGRNNRRYATFYTGQQSVDDVRKQMGGDYFTNLWKWFNNGGNAAINGYMRSLDVQGKYDPATECQRAPHTTSTDEAMSVSLGRVEQEIQEAIDRGDAGFRNGWISSIPLSRLMKDHGFDKFIPHNKRRALLETLGYVPHPALRDGRVNNTIVAENGKARLYVHTEHPSIGTIDQSQVAYLYSDAQSYSTGLSINNHATNIRTW